MNKKSLIYYLCMSVLMAWIGKIVNNTLTRKDTSGVEYKEYTDETKYDFVDQFINHAIPTSEDINE